MEPFKDIAHYCGLFIYLKPMKCPACNTSTNQFSVNNVTLDACNVGCGGVWFDNYELKKFDEAHEPTLKIPMEPKKNISRNKSPLSCPKCSDIKLFQRFSSVRRQVAVDECAGCGGIWLDAGEIPALRTEFKTELDRRKAAEHMFTDLFAKDWASARKETKSEVQDAKKIANALKFLCPSWYVPGKQKGGAF